MLKAPGTKYTKRLKLKCDELLSNVAFNFNLRRYTLERRRPRVPRGDAGGAALGLAVGRGRGHLARAGVHDQHSGGLDDQHPTEMDSALLPPRVCVSFQPTGKS
jgi:hypothetical protein